MSPLFCKLSLAAGDGWSVNHFPTAPHCVLLCVRVCVSEVVKHGHRDEEREGTCSKCMVISVEEVMESGHFYGLQDLPPEPLQLQNMLILSPFILISLKNGYWLCEKS